MMPSATPDPTPRSRPARGPTPGRSLALLLVAIVGSFTCPPGHADPQTRAVPSWGTWVDPDGDCTLHEFDEGLVVEVPGSIHSFWALRKDPAKRFNAPRIERTVEGDFMARVRVTGDLTPGEKLPGSRTPLVAAGLYMWDDSGQHVFKWTWFFIDRPGHGLMCEISPQYDIDGRRMNPIQATQDPPYMNAEMMWLRMDRKGTVVTTSMSLDGQTWHETARIETGLPASVKVGLLALNTSARPIQVGFQGLQIGQN